MSTPTLLSDLIAEALAAGVGDPDAVVDDVVTRMSAEEREQIVREIAYRQARRAIAAATPVSGPVITAPSPERVRPVTQLRPRPKPSAKVAGIRDWWQNFVSEPVTVAGREKSMGECTAADLDILARYGREVAARTAARADKLDALAAQMREVGALTVRELPRQHVQSALSA